MKKFIAIPLLFLYTLALSGMMIQLHFCGDELSSWTVNANQTTCCCEEGNQEALTITQTEDCCEDQVIDLKIDQDQHTSTIITIALDGLQQVVPAQNDLFPFTFPLAQQVKIAYSANAPPGIWQHIPLYKLHQRFTYYG